MVTHINLKGVVGASRNDALLATVAIIPMLETVTAEMQRREDFPTVILSSRPKPR
ncbi:uncharacterized protein G2W53_031416 [Senna tora]|uniref:Uncharacterized protein n=1 Tax=Senna tora TaxID=362788 RepID=A0A834WCH3_9FABA|nr:uncharacterized protein G2W53_031416 [Senna tora]